MVKIADSLRLWGLSVFSTHENWGDVSGSVHPHDEHCRHSQALSTPPHGNWATSQAFCTPIVQSPTVSGSGAFCVLQSPKVRDVSGSLHPHDENCRQSQALSTPPHGNWGTSQAVCTPIIKSPTASGSGHFRCSPTPTARDVSGSLHPHDENCRQSQALCTPSRKLWDVSSALQPREGDAVSVHIKTHHAFAVS